MNNKEFGKHLEVRTQHFAIAVIRFSGGLPESTEWKIIRHQLTKAATSIGANYHEANRSRSKADFLNKLKICLGEANEARFWLSIIQQMRPPTQELQKISKETDELLGIFTSSIYKLKMELNDS